MGREFNRGIKFKIAISIQSNCHKKKVEQDLQDERQGNQSLVY